MTFPSMLLETVLIPLQRLRQEKDWRLLCARLAGMSAFVQRQEEIQSQLRPAYQDYVSKISSPLISLSLNRAAFLLFYAQLIHAQNLLDLGSGFSSYVFRLYVRKAGRGIVVSVDDADFWLMETRRFLENNGIDTEELWTLDRYRAMRSEGSAPDLCLLDIGDFALRRTLLPDLLEDVKRHNMHLIIDDFHVPAYRGFVIKLCDEKKLQVYSLRKVTRRRLSHAALIMKQAL